MSTPGMPDACITIAMPTPETTGPFAFFALRFFVQPMALAPASIACGRPHERMICLKPSRPSPSTSAIGWSSPSCTWFWRRNSSGSRPSAWATSSTCDSSAKKPCGQPYPRKAPATARFV